MNVNVDTGSDMSIADLLRDKTHLPKAVMVTDSKADLLGGYVGCGMTFHAKMRLLRSLRVHGILSKNPTVQARGLRNSMASNFSIGKPQQCNKAIFRGTRRGR